MMNRFSLVTLLLVSASGAAFAQEGTQDFNGKNLSSRGRAEVIAELERARISGQLVTSGELYGSFRASQLGSTRTRAGVVAELESARRNGAVETRSSGPFYGSLKPADLASTRTREEVRAEVLRARAAGQHLSRGERGG